MTLTLGIFRRRLASLHLSTRTYGAPCPHPLLDSDKSGAAGPKNAADQEFTSVAHLASRQTDTGLGFGQGDRQKPLRKVAGASHCCSDKACPSLFGSVIGLSSSRDASTLPTRRMKKKTATGKGSSHRLRQRPWLSLLQTGRLHGRRKYYVTCLHGAHCTPRSTLLTAS